MIDWKKQKVLLAVPIVLGLGMGSYWLAVRDTRPKDETLTGARVVDKGQRNVADKNVDRPPRIRGDRDEARKEKGERGKRERDRRDDPDKRRRGLEIFFQILFPQFCSVFGFVTAK